MREAADRPGDREPGFTIVPIVVDEYLHPDNGALPGARRYVERIAAMLAPYGGRLDDWALPSADRTMTAVLQRLSAWARPDRPRNSLLLWVGHGQSPRFDPSWLATYETSGAETACSPGTIATMIEQEWTSRVGDDRDEWAVVVIEACGAPGFARQLTSLLTGAWTSPSRLLLIGAGPDDGVTKLGTFAEALARSLEAFNDNDDEVRMLDLVHQLKSRMPPTWVQDIQLEHAAPLRPKRSLGGLTVSGSVDFYNEMRHIVASLSDGERNHFLAKASGAEAGEQSWFFVGREQERQRLFHWLNVAPHGMAIVTGRAGSGKSALLGNLLVETNRALRQVLQDHHYLPPAEEHELPPANAFHAVIHLSGLSTDDVLTGIAEAAEVNVSADSRSAVDQLADAVRRRKKTFRILADALDEAQEPLAIAASLLRRLATLPNTVVVVGTRPSTSDGPDHIAEDQDLLDALGYNKNVDNDNLRLISVRRDERAIHRYVEKRLQDAVENGRLRLTTTMIEDVTTMITSPDREGAENRQFLYARLALYEILAEPKLIEPVHHARLEELLRGGHADLFKAAVLRLTTQSPSFLPLLQALALARGRGVSRADGTWLAMAQALSLAGVDEPVGVDELDIDDLLKAAAPYVMLDRQYGQSVYRLAHRTFQEYFESQWS